MLWGGSGQPPPGVGRACARPSEDRREGPWCFCQGAYDTSWGYCRPEVTRVRLQLLDASLWRLLSAYDGARLSPVDEANPVDCANYLRDFAAVAPPWADSVRTPAPYRCWGDSMQETGDAVFVEWPAGEGLQAGSGYALEITGMFAGDTKKNDKLLSMVTIVSTTEGPYLVAETAELGSDKQSIPKSGHIPDAEIQPVIDFFAVELLEMNHTAPASAKFRLALRPGGEESQWLRSGQLLEFFLYPLVTWDIRDPLYTGRRAWCPPIKLVVPNAESEPFAPSCTAFSVGYPIDDGSGGDQAPERLNAIRLILGSNTIISAAGESYIETTLTLPPGGLVAVKFGINVRYQAVLGQASWYTESETSLTIDPTVSRAGLHGEPEATAGVVMRVRLTLVPLATARGVSGGRIRVIPPGGYTIDAVESLPEGEPGRVVANAVLSGPAASSRRLADAAVSAGAYDIFLAEETALLAGAVYTLLLAVTASSPSGAARPAWRVQLADAMSLGPLRELGPDAELSLSGGVLVPGTLRASVMPAALHASALTTLTVYFQPDQVLGIFFRYIVLTAPRGFDFATVRDPRVAQGGAVSCRMLSVLSLPSHIQCQPRRLDGRSESEDVAELILPPLSKLERRPYGFVVDVTLPPFSMAWVEETSGRYLFSLETLSQERQRADFASELPDHAPLVPDGSTDPLPPIYPSRCDRAEVRLDSQVPEALAPVHVTLELGYEAAPPVYLYVEAPRGYRWEFLAGDWSAEVTPLLGGVTAPLDPADFGPTVLPDGRCRAGRPEVLCVVSNRHIRVGDALRMTAKVRTPRQNPDVPQLDAWLPSPPIWHVEMSFAPVVADHDPVPLSSRWLGCNLDFRAPNRVRRIFGAEATPSNSVAGERNDVVIALTTVSEVPRLGRMVIVAAAGAFAFETPDCRVKNEARPGSSSIGLALPQSAGATCLADPAQPHIAVITLARPAKRKT